MIPVDPATQPEAANPAEPLLNVTRGNPTAEELAAVTAVVLALQADSDAGRRLTPDRQFARRAQLHLPPRPGAGSWRRSGH